MSRRQISCNYNHPAVTSDPTVFIRRHKSKCRVHGAPLGICRERLWLCYESLKTGMCHCKENRDSFGFHFSSEAFGLYKPRSKQPPFADVCFTWRVLASVSGGTLAFRGTWYGRCYQPWGKASQFMELRQFWHQNLKKAQLEMEWKAELY